ncbi:hypothetical protein [Sphingomonas sp. Mn802worker]|uniref:hypothetical protein n=1 Tax=Sphingomonas sp. Mn802worker TaxID=629773 RepID=UPI00036A3808|nr:hypothetical protein [Sphingomonas sp. Mn802worker]
MKKLTWHALAFGVLAIAAPAAAQRSVSPPAVASTRAARTILFIGNSFTFGANSPLRNWRASTVTDLNGTGYGGVPALFKAFTDQAGLDYQVSLEVDGGKTLGFHYEKCRRLFDRAWDVVILQEYSTLDPERPGDARAYINDVARLSRLFARRNPQVQVQLTATWSRADQVYRSPGGLWSNKPVSQMALDLRAAADRARAVNPLVTGVLPVGQAWNRAFAAGVADPNPYDGVSFGQINLWSFDHYHASTAGYYLEALIVFGRVTGIDPTTLGPGEQAADTLGLSREQASALQRIARDQLAAE